MDAACGHPPPRTQPYRRHRPEQTPLYRVIQGHLEIWLARREAAWPDTSPVPAHVEREYRRYLECGLLAHGFARARCGACGHDWLIAFSCKGRGVCPACFVHRFGFALNAHYHYHCCVLDGVFVAEGEAVVRFIEAAPPDEAALEALQLRVRRRVLRSFERAGLLEPHEVEAMLGWEAGGGFSVDASVRIEAHDRAGLERLIRYCARPSLALERLEWDGDEALVYHLAKPARDGRSQLRLTPLELLDALTALIPPPRLHRQHYHGVLAPHAELRERVTALGREEVEVGEDAAAIGSPIAGAEAEPLAETDKPPASRYRWAVLIARIYEVDPLKCPHCGTQMAIIAFVTEPAQVSRVLAHIGEPVRAPPLAPARVAADWADDARMREEIDPGAQPMPEYDFDQRVSW